MRTVAFWLSLLLVFVIPWENIVVLEGLGTMGRATGILAAAFWVATVVVTGRFRKPHPFHLAVYLFVLWNIVSVFWTFDVTLTVRCIMTYSQLLILIYILWDLYTTPVALNAGLQAYVLGAYVSIGSTAFNYVSTGAGAGRFATTGFNENDLGLTLALGIPVAWHLALSESNDRITQVLKIVNYGYVPAGILGVLLTASRGSLVSSLPSFFFIFASLTRLKLHLRVLLCAALVGALFALQPLVPASSFQRLSTTGTSIATGDLSGRVDIWSQGITVFSQHPFLGVGSGAFRAAIERGSAPHNVYLSVLVAVGIIGFGLFWIILVMAVYLAMRQPKWVSMFWLTLLSVLAIGIFGVNWEVRKPTWLFLGLTAVSAALYSQRDETLLRPKFPAELTELPEGATDGASDTTLSVKMGGSGHTDGDSKLPFGYKTGRGSQQFPFRLSRPWI